MMATNSPGQSGDPANNHYKDLFPLWANDEYFPLYYSKEKIDMVKERVLVLKSK
jgi:penicillin amidase